jgi:hypothetical protein
MLHLTEKQLIPILTQQGHETTMYHTRGEQTNHYIIDVVEMLILKSILYYINYPGFSPKGREREDLVQIGFGAIFRNYLPILHGNF